MEEKEIEAIIEECKDGASEDAFNLDQGHIRLINHERYIDLLEHLIRTQFGNIKSE